jgi:hypothetical protein
MKVRNYKVASKSGRGNALPVRPARRTPAHGEVLPAAKKGGAATVRNPDSNDPLDHNESMEDPIWRDYLGMDPSSSQLESLSEYSAEAEVEAAMFEAELAMQAVESGLIFEEGIEEMTQGGVSLVWAEGDAGLTAVE